MSPPKSNVMLSAGPAESQLHGFVRIRFQEGENLATRQNGSFLRPWDLSPPAFLIQPRQDTDHDRR